MIDTLRKPLGVLALLAGLAMLSAHYVAVAYSLPAALWHAVAILVIVPLTLAILVNVADSLRLRRDSSVHLRQLPRDAITVAAAFILIMFVHNYLLFTVPHAEDNPGLWTYLDPAAVVILAWEGIALLRSSSRPN